MHIRRSWVRRIILVLLCAWSTLVTYLCYQREVKNPQQEHILSAVEKIETVYVVKHAIATQKSPTAIETQVTYNNTPPEHGGIKRNSSKSHRQRERYKMVVGILTALRNPPTVLSLAKRLVHVTNMSDYKLLVLQSYSAAGEVETKLALENLGYTVFTMTSEYAELEPSRLRITWGDPPSRVKWRTNHVLDYANLLEKTLDYEANFVMILEDDMMPAWHALDKAYKSLTTEHTIPHNQLGYITFYSGRRGLEPRGLKCITGNLGIEGACTLTFSQNLVPKIIAHLKSDPYANPVDMAIGGLLDKELHLQSYDRIPHLFQHNSKKSTYTESDQVKRKTEEARSIYFMYEEDNYTKVFHPSQPDGYVGCYNDSEGFSDLSGFFIIMKNNSTLPSTCREICKQFLFFGLQQGPDGIECRCGNEFGYYGVALDDECGSTNDSIRCGSLGRNGIYRVEPFTAKSVGCFGDKPDQRDLEHYAGDRHTPITCASACSNYTVFGLQNGSECYCGDSYGHYGNANLTTCMMPCVADSKLFCGGRWTNSVFHL